MLPYYVCACVRVHWMCASEGHDKCFVLQNKFFPSNPILLLSLFPLFFPMLGGLEPLTNRWHSYSSATGAQNPVLCQQVCDVCSSTGQQRHKERQRQRVTLVITTISSPIPHLTTPSTLLGCNFSQSELLKLMYLALCCRNFGHFLFGS